MFLSKFLDPKNDFAFKRIFGTEKNKDILIDFINAILGFSGPDQIKTVQFLKTSQDPDIAAKKQSLIDVLCADERGRQYIIEMQVARTAGFEKRAQYYAAKAYSRQLEQGQAYSQLKEIIFVAITDFVMFPDKEAYKSDHYILDSETCARDLRDFSFTFLELPKFKKRIDELENVVERWSYFFKHAEETKEQDIQKIAGLDPAIERAYEELNRFSWTEIELNTYEQEEKRERDAQAILTAKLEDAEAKGKIEGKIEGMIEGLIEGKIQGKMEMAKKLLAKNMNIQLINELTELPLETIMALENDKEIN